MYMYVRPEYKIKQIALRWNASNPGCPDGFKKWGRWIHVKLDRLHIDYYLPGVFSYESARNEFIEENLLTWQREEGLDLNGTYFVHYISKEILNVKGEMALL